MFGGRFEEGGFAFANNSFNGNFGLINVHGVPKPAYRGFQLLHELGNELISTSITSTRSNLAVEMPGNHKPLPDNPDCVSTVGVLASVTNATTLSVLLFSQATIGEPIAPICEISVSVLNPSFANDDVGSLQGTIRRIDETNTAPKAIWLQQGMPQWPTTEQKKAMFQGSIMRKEKFAIAIESTPLSKGSSPANKRLRRLSFNVSVAANSIAAVQVPIGSEHDLLEAERQRDMRIALAAAEKELQEATTKIAVLRESLRSAEKD